MIEKILLNKYGEYLKGLDIYEKEHSLILSRIVVNNDTRESGIGTKIMLDLVAYADENNKIVALTPSEDFGGVKNRLIKFYKRFGFVPNSGSNKNYEFRDTMIREPKINENMGTNKIKGGLSDGLSLKDIAEKHGVSVIELNSELNKGIKVEIEHVNDEELAKEIAMDHLVEMPNYYTKLEKMEKQTIKEMLNERLISYINKKS